MTSSKFNQRPPRRTPPDVCKKSPDIIPVPAPPPPPPVVCPNTLPGTMPGSGAWSPHDPFTPPVINQVFNWIGPTNGPWTGTAAENPEWSIELHMEFDFSHTHGPCQMMFWGILYQFGVPVDTFTTGWVFYGAGEPFDTGLQGASTTTGGVAAFSASL